MSDVTPQQIGNHWIVPLLAVRGDRHLVRVSVTVADSFEILGGAMAVQLKAQAQSLAQVEAPAPGTPLPFTALKGVTAHGDFWFDRPTGVSPTEVVVTLDGLSVTFDVTNTDPFIVA
jgi:hypothetical protein